MVVLELELSLAIHEVKEGPLNKSRMSFKTYQTPLNKTVADEILTVEEIEWLTKHILEELSQDLKPTQDIQNNTGERAVKAGVIRHTSYPSQPLAYYYTKK